MKTDTREAWLMKAVDTFRPWFEQADRPLPSTVRVSVGFPFGSRKAIGQCWPADASGDDHHEIFISPTIQSSTGPCGLLATLLHECCHAALPASVKHNKTFQKLAGGMGLVPPWTATSAGPDLEQRLNAIAEALGPIPYAAVTPAVRESKKQTTRLIKCACGACGYSVRTTRQWLDTAGAPICPVDDHGQMEVSS